MNSFWYGFYGTGYLFSDLERWESIDCDRTSECGNYDGDRYCLWMYQRHCRLTCGFGYDAHDRDCGKYSFYPADPAVHQFFDSNNVWTLSLVIGALGWFNLARIVRSEVRQIRNQEYVLVSRSMGAGFGHIMLRHLIPNFVSAIMFVIVSSISNSMTTEATLSFLGLGLPVEVVSWGSMLSLANRALMLNTWWVILIPGLFLTITLVCITNIGQYFRKEVNRRLSNL